MAMVPKLNTMDLAQDVPFQVVAPFEPMGDQPQAIRDLAAGVENGMDCPVLLGATGTGKTYTIAKVIEQVQKPTLVIAHNKTLAAQLASEFKTFFPHNYVGYFVSYYDFYQPEAYIASTDTYIEKDASINDEIDELRHSATCSLFERRDCIIVAPKGARPNLASQLLGLAIRELPAIWKAKWGYVPLLAETFCDIERVAGTCYRAAGWEEVGKTKGFTRSRHTRDFYIPNGRPKVLYMKPLRKDAWDLIVSNDLPRECECAAHSNADAVLPFSGNQVESLAWELCRVKDPRGRNRSVGIGPILTLYTMGVAAGAKDLKAVHDFARRLKNWQLKELGCPRRKDMFGDPVEGEYVCPSYKIGRAHV